MNKENKEDNELDLIIQKFIQIAEETYNKYELFQVETTINLYLTNGYCKYFTGEEKKWLQNNSFENIKQYLKERYQTEKPYEMTEAFIQKFIEKKKNTK